MSLIRAAWQNECTGNQSVHRDNAPRHPSGHFLTTLAAPGAKLTCRRRPAACKSICFPLHATGAVLGPSSAADVPNSLVTFSSLFRRPVLLYIFTPQAPIDKQLARPSRSGTAWPQRPALRPKGHHEVLHDHPTTALDAGAVRPVRRRLLQGTPLETCRLPPAGGSKSTN